jgi:uncharacterized protein with HEPN domain
MAEQFQIYVDHILEEIAFLQSHILVMGYESFKTDPIAFRAATYAIQCISEASRNLPRDVTEKFPHIRWRDIRGIGNHTRHEYSKLLPFLIWDIVALHLGSLQTAMLEMPGTNET